MSDLTDMIADDLENFLGDFGDVATVDGESVTGILDNEYVSVLNIEGTRPVFECRSVDVATVSKGSTVVIGSVSYRVAHMEPDGTGMTKLVLERVG